MGEMTAEEQIAAWKEELTPAMADQQWRRALQLCSWLRYALWQNGTSDSQVDEAHRRAKEGLAEAVDRETEQEKGRVVQRRRRQEIQRHIVTAQWSQALSSLDAFHQEGASREEIRHLLKELQTRMGRILGLQYRQMNRRAAVLGRRFDDLEERTRKA